MVSTASAGSKSANEESRNRFGVGGYFQDEPMMNRTNNALATVLNAFAALIGYPTPATEGVLTRRLSG